MINEVLVNPDPFTNAFTLEINCNQNLHAIVRLINAEDRIVKLFSWYLLKGANITSIEDISSTVGGKCRLDVINQDGTLLHTIDVTQSN
ncbi:hypothetical protein HHL16_20365 [Pseudoflavitalea sp. G-6-1-2]|uniref:hypothetical protein n=1 Tax=Pseudoflavitalea sp. G-6-1-2 TaxID=2728841 RepID=UPI00146B8C35|nr:hypothetical protein [Pseudoflavitalea sp. G-6-1-2]NML23244.1 hypothetical protein [Pseudoflavitalea sp. G-6-1-2]